MRLIDKFIIIFMIFAVMLLFLSFTQVLPGWLSTFQKTLLNNVFLFMAMGIMIWVAVQ